MNQFNSILFSAQESLAPLSYHLLMLYQTLNYAHLLPPLFLLTCCGTRKPDDWVCYKFMFSNLKQTLHCSYPINLLFSNLIYIPLTTEVISDLVFSLEAFHCTHSPHPFASAPQLRLFQEIDAIYPELPHLLISHLPGIEGTTTFVNFYCVV